MRLPTKNSQFKTTEHLYIKLELAMAGDLYDSKKHKAYYLFTVLFSEGWWVEDNVAIVRKAVRDHSLNLIWERRDPAKKDDDNIHIYFLENEKGKHFIVLVRDPIDLTEGPELLCKIPVKRNDYEMTRIYPRPARPKRKIARNKSFILEK